MHGARIGGLVAAAVVVIAAFMPWATVEFFVTINVNGTEADGVLTLLLGLAAGVLVGVWKRPTVIIAAVLFGLAAIIALFDLVNVGRVAGEMGDIGVSPGFGLVLTLLAALAGVAVAVVGQNVLAAGGQPGLSLATLNRGATGPTTTLRPQGTTAYPAQSYGAQPYGAEPYGAEPYGARAAAPYEAQPAQPTQHYAAQAAAAAPSPVAPPPPPAPAPVPQPAQPPAGWHPDPTTPGQLRYWDGAQWTEHVHPA